MEEFNEIFLGSQKRETNGASTFLGKWNGKEDEISD